MPTAKTVLDLVRRGYLNALLKCEESKLADAINIGREWLGENHPALQCLRIGVAVHHGQRWTPLLIPRGAILNLVFDEVCSGYFFVVFSRLK